jgi:hypothetical protein
MKKMNYFLMTMMFCFSANVFAKNVVLKVSANSKIVYFKFSNKNHIETGDTLISSSSKQDQLCKLTVIKIKQDIGVANSKKCKIKLSKLFFKGDELVEIGSPSNTALKGEESKSINNDRNTSKVLSTVNMRSEVGAKITKQTNKKHYFGGQLFHSMANEIEYEGSTANFDVKQTDQTDKAFGINAFYKYRSFIDLGFLVGLEYEFGRTLKTYKTKFVGLEEAGNYSSSRDLDMLVITNNLSYHFTDLIFAYSGINFPVRMRMKNYNNNYEGELGYQLGLGFEVAANSFLALEYREVNATAEIKDIGLKFEKMSMQGTLLRLGFQF